MPTPSGMRRTTLYVAAVLGLLVACAIATVLVTAEERGAAAAARDRHADRAVGRLQAELTSAEEALRGIEALFSASERVTPAEFAAYTRHLLVSADLERLAYAELVPGRERRTWERRTGLTIRTLGPAGLRPAPPRAAYLPVRFLRGRRSAGLLGWDMSSEPARAAALAAARSARDTRVTAPVRLIAPDRPGVLMVLPVYGAGRGPGAEARGFVVGGHRVDELARQATADLAEGTRMRIADGAQVLAGPAEPLPGATRRDVSVAGRTWTVDVTGGPGASWAPTLGVGGAGLAVTALLALLFRQAARRERYALELLDARLRERDAAESRLRASEEAFRMLAEGSTDMISLHWPDGRYVYVSPSSEELVGYAPEELAGRSPRDFLHPEDVARLEREAPDEDDAGVVTTSFRFRHRDGHYTWLEATERLIRDDAGRVVEVRAAARCIDARMHAEIALREREERIRSLVQSASDAIVMADGDGNIISWNEAATRIFGHEPESALGRPLGIIMPERYRQGHARAFAAVAAGAEPRLMNQVIELEGLRADGTEFPLELTLGTWQSDGERYFAGVIRDVSARKAEEAERQSDERFRRALLGSLSEGVAACDADGRLVFFNDARRHLHAFDESLPKTLEGWAASRTLFHPDGVTPLRADEMPLARVLAGETVREQTVVTLAGGVRRTLLVAGQPILDDERRPIGAVTAAHDVTERLETQARLEHTTRQLESILDAVGEGVYGLDPEGRVTFANPAAAAMLGWDVEELLGQSQHGLVHPSGHERRSPDERSQIWSVLEDGTSRRVEDELFWRRDGHCFPVSYVTSPLRDHGRLVGAVVTFQDISERRAVERMKDEFVSMVSHELRTPLTSIRGALSILADGDELPPAAERRMLEIACANTERLVRLINDILDLERIGSGEEELQLGSWCARGLVADAVALIAPLAEEHRVSITTAAPEAPMAVDPHRIIQVLTNLLGNAIKFSPAGGRVTVGGRVAGDEVVLTIADEGRGIPADKLETIFERFQQVDASDARQAGGTGLGLAICRRIATLHGGRVWAESRHGEGSVFHLALPLSSEPAETRSLPFLGAAI